MNMLISKSELLQLYTYMYSAFVMAYIECMYNSQLIENVSDLAVVAYIIYIHWLL